MKTQRAGVGVLLLALCLLAVGCLTTTRGPGPEALITPLPELTTAVDALVRWPPDGVPMSGPALVEEVLKDNEVLRAKFARVPVKVWHDNRYVVLLVCSPDGKWAWLEDASWTPEVDRLWYQSKPPVPAGFTLQPPAGGR